jgi:hypothetical protein
MAPSSGQARELVRYIQLVGNTIQGCGIDHTLNLFLQPRKRFPRKLHMWCTILECIFNF